MSDIIEIIQSRRSIRSYKPDQISQESLEKIIKAGIYAPSAHNQQSWHFTVIQNPQVLDRINIAARASMLEAADGWVRRMAENPSFRVTYDAPTLIIVSGRQDALAWSTDCSAAIQNMLLAAESLGIGSVWLGLMRYYFSRVEEVEKLNIPDGYKPFYGVAFGYKSGDVSLPVPKRNTEVVSYIR